MAKPAAKKTAAAKVPKPAAAPKRTGPEFLRNETRLVPVQLTDGELRDRGRAVGTAMAQLREIELAHELVKESYKAKKKAVNATIATAARALETGSELRSVGCKVYVNEGITRVETIRDDTGAIVDTRALEPEERQRRLFRAGEAQVIPGTRALSPAEAGTIADDLLAGFDVIVEESELDPEDDAEDPED